MRHTEPVIEKKEDVAKVEVTEPLAPPPRPAVSQTVSNTPDYFSIVHGNLSHETNPFEHSFAGGGGTNGGGLQTPGGTKLPSVAALTSPAGLLGASGSTPGFWGGLRSGPLSPAMLSGPQKDDYFSDGHHLRGGFPTPNESSMRSGLTPGGGGSMFPEPSPGTQAMFNSLASGGATPGTLDFQRAAVNAASANKRAMPHPQSNVTSQPQNPSEAHDVKPNISQFDRHDAADAANGLFMLANASPQQTNHYAVAPPMPVHAHPQSNMQRSGLSTETSPHMGHRNGGSISTNSARGASEASGYSDDNEQQARPNTRGKGKRANTQTNGRRKADEAPAKAPANKKSKTNSGMAMAMEPEPQSEEELDMNKDEYNANGKKMTDEEKRKNFLERNRFVPPPTMHKFNLLIKNRVAALKCRQRKKQWLANLQQKVEMFSSENDSLSAQISQLREEVVNLKTLLLAHKDCPVTQQQGLQGMGMQHIMDNGYGPPMGGPGQMHPYGMALGQQVMAGPGMQQQRRYS